ncbi:MAG: nucleoside monophosphate kinase [Patescibacteria group bacterium]|nr:nucleoside monophosphate kinase [Patescibacteria group bacterium]
MIFSFIGRAFAGKGTQAKMLGEKLGLPVFGMGNLIRKARESGDKRAIEGFEKYSMKGMHLPASFKFDFLREKMDSSKSGFILDNFPATTEDLNVLFDYLTKNNLNIEKVFYITISEGEIKKRIKERGREDDEQKVIIKRLEIQDKDRIPVIEYFKNKGILEEINGEKEINAVFSDILSRLGGV